MRSFQKRFSVVHIGVVLSLLPLFFPAVLSGPNGKGSDDKIAPGLARVLQYYEATHNNDAEIPVIAQVDRDFFHPNANPLGLRNPKSLELVNGYADRVPVRALRGLLKSPILKYVTFDSRLQATNELTKTIGLDQTYSSSLKTVSNDLGYDGTGQTVAIFDSGLTGHGDIGSSRIPVKMDFTSGSAKRVRRGNDSFGHGTHVTGIIGGSGYVTDGFYSGVAPATDLISIKVLDKFGVGLTSNVILAIDWVIQNKDEYNIRLANLSLGHPAFESYTVDPLCQAVRAMVDAGIVTVVSAGNLGKTANHPELWGGITSPGTEPSVITVGAANTKGTLTLSDDVTTSYSSRGYTVPDQVLKPDLVAPGNWIPSTLAAGSYLKNNYPELLIDLNYMYLSGSSMATAFVSGTVALILEANPDLSPNQVKTVLLLTAVKMTQPHILEQGNGFLNAYTAVKLAEQIDVASQSLLGNVNPVWILEGEDGPEEVVAGGAFVWDDRVFYSDLVAPNCGFWGEGVIWADNLFDPGSVVWTDNFFDPGSVIWSDFFDSVIWADFFDSVIWADFFDSVIWADFFDSVIWADFFDPGSVIWADTVIWNDQPADSAVLGDE